MASNQPVTMASDGLKRTQRCQVDGCGFDLSTAKKYHYKRRLCPFHMQASAVYCSCLSSSSSGLYRFCQQCGRLQPLEDFEGNKKSCQESLTKRREGVLAIKAAAECYFAAQEGGEPDVRGASSGYLSDSSIGIGHAPTAKQRKRKHGQKVPPAITRKQKRRCKSQQQVQASGAAAAAGYPAEPAAVPGHVEGDGISPKSSSHSVAESTATPTAPQQLLQTAALEHLYMNAEGSTGYDVMIDPTTAAVAPSDMRMAPPPPAAAAANAVCGSVGAAVDAHAVELPAVAAVTELLPLPTSLHLSGLELSGPLPAWLSGPDQAETTSPGQIPGGGQSAGGRQQQQQQVDVSGLQLGSAAGHAQAATNTATAAAAANAGTRPAPLQLFGTQQRASGLTASLGVSQLLPNFPRPQQPAAAVGHNVPMTDSPGSNGAAATAAPTRSQVLGSAAADDHFLHCKVPNCELCVTSIMNRLMKDLQHEAQDGKPASEAVVAQATSRLDLMPAQRSDPSNNGNPYISAAAAATTTTRESLALQQQREMFGMYGTLPTPLSCTGQNSITGKTCSRPPFMMTAPYAALSASGQVPQNLLLNRSNPAAAAAAADAAIQFPSVAAVNTGVLGFSTSAVHTALGVTNNSSISQMVAPNTGNTSGVSPWSVSNGVNNNITNNGYTRQQVMHSMTRMLWMLEQFSAYVEEVKGVVMRSVNNMPE